MVLNEKPPLSLRLVATSANSDFKVQFRCTIPARFYSNKEISYSQMHNRKKRTCEKQVLLSGIKNSWKYEKDLIIFNRNFLYSTISHYGNY